MTRAEVIQLDHWRYKIQISTDDHKPLVLLPDSNWYSRDQTKRVIETIGTTCIDVCSLQENDKKFILGLI